MDKYKYLVAVLISVIALTLILSSRNEQSLKHQGIQTEVKILDVIRKRKGITTSEQIAIIEYSTVNGLIESRIPYNTKMIIGRCYKGTYSASNVQVVKLQFKESKKC